MICFIFIGAFIMVLKGIYYPEMSKICDGTSSYSNIYDAFNKVYSSADSIYCVSSSSSGCLCLTQSAISGTYYGKIYYTSQTSTLSGYTVVTKVQDCKNYLSSAYTSYGLTFNDLNALITHLDYFGVIEKYFSCSGFCKSLPVYYFYDSNYGAPLGSCMSLIQSQLLDNEAKYYGIVYIVAGCVIFLSWSIQFGLCCRKNELKINNTNKA